LSQDCQDGFGFAAGQILDRHRFQSEHSLFDLAQNPPEWTSGYILNHRIYDGTR
jgi:hypothetical protein